MTVKEYEFPAGKLPNVAVEPVPVCTIAPGLAVTVHVPEAGNPLKSTVPFGKEHVG